MICGDARDDHLVLNTRSGRPKHFPLDQAREVSAKACRVTVPLWPYVGQIYRSNMWGGRAWARISITRGPKGLLSS